MSWVTYGRPGVIDSTQATHWLVSETRFFMASLILPGQCRSGPQFWLPVGPFGG